MLTKQARSPAPGKQQTRPEVKTSQKAEHTEKNAPQQSAWMVKHVDSLKNALEKELYFFLKACLKQLKTIL